MRSSSVVQGLKIISLNEGQQIGIVKDTIIDSLKGKLAYFVVDKISDYLGARIISFADVIGWGDYALLVSDSKVIKEVANSPEAIELLMKDIKIIGKQVLTKTGSLAGEVTEIKFDDKSGIMKLLLVKDQNGNINEVKCDLVVTYGIEMIIIDEAHSHGKTVVAVGSKKAGKQTADTNHSHAVNVNIAVDSEKELHKNKESAEIDFPEDFNIFEQRQLQFLLGKTIVKDIELENGQILKVGQQMTASFLSMVKTRSTLMELTAHLAK